jgi:hypothetical protein
MPLGDALLRGTRINHRDKNQEYEKYKILQSCMKHWLHPLLCLWHYVEFVDKLKKSPDIIVIVGIS